MKKIIVPGIQKEYIATCQKCHCVFSYENEDIISTYSDDFVICPYCQSFIISYNLPQKIITLQGGTKTTDATE